MTREEFATLVGSRPVILDGATGTNLQKAGMPVGVCPEQWILENPGVLIELQERYVEAGTDILFAPTFTASRIKLEEYGLENSLVQMNRELVALSKRAAGGASFYQGTHQQLPAHQRSISDLGYRGRSCQRNLIHVVLTADYIRALHPKSAHRRRYLFRE